MSKEIILATILFLLFLGSLYLEYWLIKSDLEEYLNRRQCNERSNIDSVVNIARDYSRCPGVDGSTGEEFRKNFLEPIFNSNPNATIKLVLDDALGYPLSFLKEAFVGLGEKFSDLNPILQIQIISNDEPGLIHKIRKYIYEGQKIGKEKKSERPKTIETVNITLDELYMIIERFVIIDKCDLERLTCYKLLIFHLNNVMSRLNDVCFKNIPKSENVQYPKLFTISANDIYLILEHFAYFKGDKKKELMGIREWFEEIKHKLNSFPVI